jgi:hypothetical protein
MAQRAVATSFTTATQQFLAAGAEGTLDHVVLVESTAVALFLSVWVVDSPPVLPLLAAARVDVIPIGASFAGTIPIGQFVGQTSIGGIVVAVTTGSDATGNPAAAVFASFRWDS